MLKTKTGSLPLSSYVARLGFPIAFMLLNLCSLHARAPIEYSFYQDRLKEIAQMQTSELVFLGDSLTQRHDWSRFSAANMGIDGDTTDGVLARMHLCKKAKRVVLMIGVNDILTNTPLKQIEQNYRQILESFLPEQDIILLSLLPVIDDPSTKQINQKIRDLNTWLRAHKGKYAFIDLYSHFLDAKHLGLESSYTLDGIHLNKKAYTIWEEQLNIVLNKY